MHHVFRTTVVAKILYVVTTHQHGPVIVRLLIVPGSTRFSASASTTLLSILLTFQPPEICSRHDAVTLMLLFERFVINDLS